MSLDVPVLRSMLSNAPRKDATAPVLLNMGLANVPPKETTAPVLLNMSLALAQMSVASVSATENLAIVVGMKAKMGAILLR
jgi:hypothetical protein